MNENANKEMNEYANKENLYVAKNDKERDVTKYSNICSLYNIKCHRNNAKAYLRHEDKRSNRRSNGKNRGLGCLEGLYGQKKST